MANTVKRKKKVQVELSTDQSTEVEGAKNLDDYDQSRPMQLTLFELLLPQERGLSNTIELYDFIPKYHWGKVERIGGEFLRALEREFECRGQKYKVKIRPASIEDKDGMERYYYPSKRGSLRVQSDFPKSIYSPRPGTSKRNESPAFHPSNVR